MKRIAVSLIGAATMAVMLATSAAGAISGRQTITLYSGPRNGTAQLFGPITDSGKDFGVSDMEDRLVLGRGTVVVTHVVLTNGDVNNNRNCTVKVDEAGTYALTGVSGAYKGATGSGHFHAVGTLFLDATPRGCRGPGHGLVVVHGAGTTTLP